MDIFTQRKNAKALAKEWSGSNYKEKGNVGKFWIELLEQVYGIENGSKVIDREVDVPNMDNKTDYIDVYIPSTKVLIEQKSPTKKLDKKEKRSFGYVTPYEQAKTYDDNLKWRYKAKWIITCNFHEFWIYNMMKSGTRPTPTKLELKDLWKNTAQLDFIINNTRRNVKREANLSIRACKIIDKIYHSLLNQYSDKKDPVNLRNVNKICVRLVFCFYADDSGIFGKHSMFHDYMSNIDVPLWNVMLKRLFKVLDESPKKRHNDQLDDKIAQFPYVNGGMFADDPADHVEIPNFTANIAGLILNESYNFNWSDISPTIFGALFESTLNPQERHTNGMHYTSVKNIHKVIEPLFLSKLRDEINVLETKYKDTQDIIVKSKQFQNKLASLTFFDPACGSGNFLTETYLCLRKLENEAIKWRLQAVGSNKSFNKHSVKVSIHQFYGIEINDFAISVAKTAMWIAESQMAQETQDIIQKSFDFLPLKSNPNIIEANALTVNWDRFIKDPSKLNYILSNPPFVGSGVRNHAQQNDMKRIFKDWKNMGRSDFVTCWFKKAADMMRQHKNIQTTLVATNSICQGKQAVSLWKPLLKDYGLTINFAFTPFLWHNDAEHQASVYCVIVGFSYRNNSNKIIFNGKEHIKAKNINAYLKDMPNIFVEEHKRPLCNVPVMKFGNMPRDKGYLSKWSDLDKQDVCTSYKSARKLFKRLLGAREFLHNKVRWCLWLNNVEPSEWLKIKPIREAVENVKKYREGSKARSTQRAASTPFKFVQISQPDSNYLIMPRATSGRRKYIPIGFEPKDVIATDLCFVVPKANYYMFGIMSSRMHAIWTALVSGRLKMDYRYSAKITYNNFPWPKATDDQKKAISKTANDIIKTRKSHYGEPLSALYNSLSMPTDLQKAHRANDRAVLKAYGLKSNSTKNEIITKLLKMYARLAKNADK